MQIRVETEKKYYCMEPERMMRRIESLGFVQKSKVFESDEYFTDIDSEFIRNRTCLRIRKTDKKMEITFKGKSNNLLGLYCKLENNITANIEDYNNYIKLFTSLGYYSYVIVNKERITYNFTNNKYEYNIMMDKLDSIGGFVEFEIISNDSTNGEELKKLLEIFVSKFDNLNLKEANKPYRDIVSEDIFKKIASSTIEELYIDLDGELNKYEKDFFKKNKELISQLMKKDVKWKQYKMDSTIDKELTDIVNTYLKNLIFDSSELLVTLKLLSNIDLKTYIVTNINRTFFTKLFEKLGFNINNIIFLEDENINKIIKKQNKDLSDVAILNNKDVKEINSKLLVLINNKCQ